MQKISFCNRYGLTAAVLQGRKTMTRRICKEYATRQPILSSDVESFRFYPDENIVEFVMKDGTIKVSVPTYKDKEVVAVAQSYKDLGYTKEWVDLHISPNPNANRNDPFEKIYPGWNNKMFVPAELNKAHLIKITGVRIEKLQAISNDDCLKEGVTYDSLHWVNGYKVAGLWNKYLQQSHWRSPREAFAALINSPGVGRKGLWESNPFVVVYEFKLVK